MKVDIWPNISINEIIQSNISINEIIYLTFEFSENSLICDHYLKDILISLHKLNEFSGKKDEMFSYNSFYEDKLIKILFVGLGKREDVLINSMKMTVANAIRNINKKKTKSINILPCFGDIDEEKRYSFVKAVAEAAVMTTYTFNKYKTKSSSKSIDVINIICEDDEINRKAIDEGVIVGESVNMARDLVNEPPNKIYPETLAEYAKKLGKDSNIEVDIYDENWIKENKLEALYSVGKGAENKPRFIVLKYIGKPECDEMVGLVGKGVTFDAGGYNLKKSEGLAFMKSDMGGAAAVLGAIHSVAKMKLPKNVIAAIPACENMIGSNAYKSGEVIHTLSGQSVEVGNTDAEGRLAIADAIYYLASKKEVTKLIDIATLTGNAAKALGSVCSAVLSNNDELYSKFENASQKTGERIWRLPLFEEYNQYISSTIADINNTSMKKSAGAILAGLFISKFVCEKPWIHIDIAGTNASMMPKGYIPKGATGVGVRLIYEYLKNN